MGHLVLAALSLAAVTAVIATARRVARTAPGAHLPPLHRPPVGSTIEVHRDDLPWCDIDVAVPDRNHHCWPHSGGWKPGPDGHTWYERCPCGAYRDDEGPWHARNSYRHRDGATLYVATHPYFHHGGVR